MTDEMVDVIRPDGRRSKIPKSSLSMALTKGYKSAAPATPTAASVGPTPGLFSKAGAKSAMYNATESTADAMPSMGATAGGLIGGGAGTGAAPGPGTVLGATGGAGIGGMGGEAAKQLIKRLVFGEGPKTTGEGINDISKEGAMQAVLEFLGQGVGRGLKKMRGVFPSVRSVDGIPLTQSERTGSKAASMTEHFMERSMPSAGPMQEFRDKQTKAIIEKAQEVSESINGFKGTQEERGRFIQKAIEEGRTKMSKEVSKAYGEFDKIASSKLVDTARGPILQGGAPVNPVAIRRAASNLLSEIKQQKAMLDPADVEPLVKYLTQIKDSKDLVDFTAAERSRGTLLSMIRKYDGVLGNRKTAILRQLEDGLDRDMTKAIKESGNPQIEVQLKIARSLSREQHRIFDQQLMKNLVEGGKPEALAGYVRNAGLQEVRDMATVLGADKKKMVAAQVMEDILGDTLKKPAPVPKGLFAKLAPKAEVFQGDQFVKSIRDMGPEKTQLIFGAAYPKLERFLALAERVKPGGSEWMALHNALYVGAVAGIPLGQWHAAALVGVEAKMMNLMAKAMVRPEGLDAATKYLAAIARHSPRAAKLALDEFAAVERDERGDPMPWVTRPPVPQELRP